MIIRYGDNLSSATAYIHNDLDPEFLEILRNELEEKEDELVDGTFLHVRKIKNAYITSMVDNLNKDLVSQGHVYIPKILKDMLSKEKEEIDNLEMKLQKDFIIKEVEKMAKESLNLDTRFDYGVTISAKGLYCSVEIYSYPNSTYYYDSAVDGGIAHSHSAAEINTI